MTKPLKVYKASAGSGKTFTLAVEYIKLLIKNPEEYKFILAVTFTNKATGEMKTRILSTLYGLANNLTDSDDYLDAIKKDESIKKLQLTDSEIREKCSEALHNIIHDYSRFRIETIDSFFQSIIRELTRELDLTANLRIDLNAQEVLEEAVEEIIDDIGKKDDLFDTILRFVKEKIEEGTNWQINSEVSRFGGNIFKEDFLRNHETITNSIKDAKQIMQFKKELLQLKEVALDELEKLGNGLLSEIDACNITMKDIKNGEKIVGSFAQKLVNRTITEASATLIKYAENGDAMCGAKASNALRETICTRIQPLLYMVVKEQFPKLVKIYNTVNAITKHLNHLMLLNAINEKVRKLNHEANRFLLADSAHFLNELIDGSDIPFIYEKAGIRFKHIMIDEFQDTSALQWENFKPLISNSMSNQDSCLIVGDVKQSIYRWRDSDWQILNKRIKEEYGRYLDDDSLKTNYRSAGNVIRFNNQFFNMAKTVINEEYKKAHNCDSQDLLTAYSDVRQLVHEKNEGRGFVYIENHESDEKEDFTPRRILDTVKNLHEEGINYNDITILVRENKHIPELCKYFSMHSDEIDTKIVSDEAFRLDSSEAINLIILALTAIKDLNDRFALRNFAIHYQMAINNDASIKDNANEFFLASDQKIKDLLPEHFIENMDVYSFMPLHELIEELYEVLSLKNIEEQDAYLFYFHDLLGEYVMDSQTDIDSFLKYWDEKMCSKTIPNASTDGIRIMSIHKSKGLEFHTVIIPYCDWSTMVKNSNLLWCEPNQEPFNKLPIVPVNCDKTLDTSIFQPDYREEVLKNNVDNLNLIYVAFTRASENLIVLTSSKPKKKEPTSVSNIQQVVVKSLEKLMINDKTSILEDEQPIEIIEQTEGNTTFWSCGTPVPSKEKHKKDTENVLEQKYNDITTSFTHVESNVEFRQSNESEKLIIGDDEEENDDYLERGLIYHKVFELIKTKNDIDEVINELDGKGYFDSAVSVDEARKNIREAINNPIASRWFDEGWKEFKECTIMYRTKNGVLEERRPDRVITNDNETIVIDYKSGKENEDYKKQVSWYMTLLRRMGYKNVKGYVWYFMNNKIDDAEQKGGSK